MSGRPSGLGEASDDELLLVPEMDTQQEDDDVPPLPVNELEDEFTDEGAYNSLNVDEQGKNSDNCCFHKDQKRFDIYITLVQVSILLVCGGIGLLVHYDKHKSTGLCLLAASFDRGGVVYFSRLVYWCDIILYNIMICASVALSCITSKWIGQLFAHIKWLKIELICVIVTACLCLLALILYSYNMGEWCSQLNLGRQPDIYAPPDEHSRKNTCGSTEVKPPSLPQCQCDARFMDEVYKPSGDIRLETAYVYACLELAFSWLIMGLWILLIVMMAKRYKMAYDARKAWERSVEEACRQRAATETFIPRPDFASLNRVAPPR